jgi:hypothetical protein
VAEVLSKTKVRMSVTGWFHGPTVKREVYTDPKPTAPKDITEEEFYWCRFYEASFQPKSFRTYFCRKVSHKILSPYLRKYFPFMIDNILGFNTNRNP